MQVMSGLLPREASSFLDPSFPSLFSPGKLDQHYTARAARKLATLRRDSAHSLDYYRRDPAQPSPPVHTTEKPVWGRYTNVLSALIPSAWNLS